VRRLLELLEAHAVVKFIHRVVDGRYTFIDLLGRWPDYRGYRLGYIACHEAPATLRIGTDSIGLGEIPGSLAERGATFPGKTLYFGSCAVLAMPPSRLTAFRTATGRAGSVRLSRRRRRRVAGIGRRRAHAVRLPGDQSAEMPDRATVRARIPSVLRHRRGGGPTLRGVRPRARL
jgi:hypothetical protein